MEINKSPEYIDDLPIQEEEINGEVKKFRVDTQQKIVYELHPKTLKWNGNCYPIELYDPVTELPNADPLIPPELIQELQEEDEFEEPARESEESVIPIPLDGELQEESFWHTYKNYILIAAALIVCILSVRIWNAAKEKAEYLAVEQSATEESFHGTRTAFEDSQTYATEEDPSDTHTASHNTVAETTEPEETVSVLIARKDLLPGDMLDGDAIGTMELTLSEYEGLPADSCLPEKKTSLIIGKYAECFIKKGDYLTADTATDTFSPINPWGTDSPNYIDIPINHTTAPACPIGSKMTLTLTIDDTIHYSAQSPVSYEGTDYTGTAAAEGSRWYVTLTLDNVTVIDWFNDKGTSLFPSYYAYAQVPAEQLYDVISEKYKDRTLFWREYPSYARIHLSPEQYALIESMSNKRSAVFGTAIPVVEASSQADLYEKLSNVYAELQVRWIMKLGG